MMSVVVCSRSKGSRANANNDLEILKHKSSEISSFYFKQSSNGIRHSIKYRVALFVWKSVSND